MFDRRQGRRRYGHLRAARGLHDLAHGGGEPIGHHAPGSVNLGVAIDRLPVAGLRVHVVHVDHRRRLADVQRPHARRAVLARTDALRQRWCGGTLPRGHRLDHVDRRMPRAALRVRAERRPAGRRDADLARRGDAASQPQRLAVVADDRPHHVHPDEDAGGRPSRADHGARDQVRLAEPARCHVPALRYWRDPLCQRPANRHLCGGRVLREQRGDGGGPEPHHRGADRRARVGRVRLLDPHHPDPGLVDDRNHH